MRFLILALVILTAPATALAAEPVPSAETPVATAAGSGEVAPARAPTASELHNPAIDPAAAFDDVQAARRLGWPVAVGAIVVMLALALGTAGASISWLSWLARGTSATVLGAVSACGAAAYNAAAAGGSYIAIGTAVVAAAIAFWKAHRGHAQAPGQAEPPKGTP